MLEGIAIDPSLWSVLRWLILPLILISFYFDGMIVGKVFPPAALYISYVALVSLTLVALVALTVACVIASTLGQWTLYRWLLDEKDGASSSKRWIPYLHRIPSMARSRIGRRRMLLVSRNFDRFGGFALAVTNTIPGIRSIMTIPAGLSHYPQRRFILFSTIGNAGYLVLLWLIAAGIVRVAGIFPSL